jgi:hypothetical protein
MDRKACFPNMRFVLDLLKAKRAEVRNLQRAEQP